MKIVFRTSKLRKLANNYKKCLKKMGARRAKAFHIRLNQLSSAETLEDTRNLPGNYHELTGTRKGQWACDLDQPYRLVFEPINDPVPTDEHGIVI